MTTDLKNQLKQELLRTIGLSLNEIPSRQELEEGRIKRDLPEGAFVTRVAPSPTGFVHIGTVYAALICQRLAHQTGGIYFIRIEDTDKKREIEGGADMIMSALEIFGLSPDEGPYKQSDRQKSYLSYAFDLLDRDLAYPCFATPQELEANIKAQQAAKLRPGYYGDYALWRNKSDEDIQAALAEGKPFILRFKSMGSHLARVEFDDGLKGHLSLPQNDLDIPLIKGDGSGLPTYHLAHIVDDYLMSTNLVIRGDEWLPSTPLHIELAQSFGLQAFKYAHIAPISIIDKNGGGKRKLSKRKDPEANVAFFYELGYPVEALKSYLLGLASSDFEAWREENPVSELDDFKLTLEKLAKSRSPLYDEVKLRDYSKDYIATLDNETYAQRMLDWLREYGSQYCDHFGIGTNIPEKILVSSKAELMDAFAIERTGEKIRKDVAKWSDVIEEYGYFVDEVYDELFQPRVSEQLAGVDSGAASLLCAAFLKTYSVEDDQQTWFEKLKRAAESSGFATDNKAYKENPAAYKGNVADAAKIIRVKLTGKNRSPDLCAIMKVMGLDRVTSRLTM